MLIVGALHIVGDYFIALLDEMYRMEILAAYSN